MSLVIDLLIVLMSVPFLMKYRTRPLQFSLAAPVPEALDPVVLLLCVLNGGLPFLIVQRYKAIASHTPEKWCISYYVIFIGILLFNIYMLAARLSSLLF